ncbi:RNA-directed DNA polymerase (Reverse transcriptase), partial [Trifolium medium]|nr:RNA-directed DNA polymerase (Reverse transcriptase) [Trifolium medium]
VNEVIDLAKKTGRECLVLKVDFEKAYDSVDWGFLEYMLRRFGFGEKWIEWIRACVFAGNLSILVNGCPTSEINIQRGLKQGDPLAPFLFLLVAEGFAGLMRSAVDKNLFKGFGVGSEGLVVSHLQYADDTLCIGEATMDNLWALKAILRGFELASGLKVNFWKSCLIGVNVTTHFMDMACNFLNCKQGVIPFGYLGLPVGANPRRCATWDPLIEKLRRRLSSWRNRFVSLGGRIVLINSVLNAIPIFFLSFLKAPATVIKKIVRIQREFLWGGVKGGRKISWVSWKEVCKPKCQGGLGVRDVGKVNRSLLIKWRWRLLQKDNALWKDILVAKYGNDVRRKLHWIGSELPRKASAWWRDISGIDDHEGGSWFAQHVIRRLGDGYGT